MTRRSMELRTLQQYKEYAESTEQLNQALNTEIKQCYRQIDTLRNDLRQHSTLDYQHKLSDYQNKLADLQSRNQLHLSDIYNLKSTVMRLESDLRSQQTQNSQRARLLNKLEEDLGRQKVLTIEAERKAGELQAKLRLAEADVNRQGVLLRELQQVGVMSVVEGRRKDQNEDMRVTLGANQQRIKGLEGELRRGQEDNAWLKQLVADKAALEELLMKQVTTVTNQRIAAEKMIKELEGQLAVFKGELTDTKNSLSTSRLRLKDTQSKLNEEETKSRMLKENLTRLQSQQNYDVAIEELSMQLEERNRIIHELQCEIERLDAKIQECPENELELAVNEINFLRNQNSDLKSQIQKLSQQLTNLKSHLGCFQQQIKKIDPAMRLSSGTLPLSKLDSSRLKSQYAQALRKNNQLIQANAKLQISKNQLLSELENLKKSLNSFKDNQNLSKQNEFNYSNSVPSLRLSLSNNQNKPWKREVFPIPEDFQRRIKLASGEHWTILQKRLDNLKSENQMLKKDLSFSGGSGWRA